MNRRRGIVVIENDYLGSTTLINNYQRQELSMDAKISGYKYDGKQDICSLGLIRYTEKGTLLLWIFAKNAYPRFNHEGASNKPSLRDILLSN